MGKNKCELRFLCLNRADCVYRSGEPCKYYLGGYCTSAVARANAIEDEVENEHIRIHQRNIKKRS